MVKHIVFWTLKEWAAGRSAADNGAEIKKRLEALNGKIPGLIHLEVGIDFSRTEASCDVALYAEFESREALKGYQSHPEHSAAAEFISNVRESRLLVDYEV
ncbi:MAG TPA: Dabb family protein [Acidobacteriota bacterium]|nr:Dabb family protein [Acidobacteriota bacterium]